MTDDKKRLWEWVESKGAIVDVDGVRPHTFRHRRHLQAPHRFAWDDWQEHAVAAAVGAELAQLGRSVMREADQHGWDEDLQRECGWDDDGAAMIALALADPDEARDRWSWLMNTDGERVDPVTFAPLDEENDDDGDEDEGEDEDEDQDQDGNEDEGDAGDHNRH